MSKRRCVVVALVVASILLFGTAGYCLLTTSQVAPISPSNSASNPVKYSEEFTQASPNSFIESEAWKTYTSTQYRFQIKYPFDWSFNSDYGTHTHHIESIGQVESLFDLEKDGASQTREVGDFIDGALVAVEISDTPGLVAGGSLHTARPSDSASTFLNQWVRDQMNVIGGDRVQDEPISANGFIGSVRLVYSQPNLDKSWGEAGAAYRILQSGHVVLITWQRMNAANKFAYQEYLLPMLSSFEMME
jgi:hypothetical protein